MWTLCDRLLDMISPRRCVVCGCRLSPVECDICMACFVGLPYTDFLRLPHDNKMTELLMGQMPLERAAALFYFRPHTNIANLIYSMKYLSRPHVGITLGRMMAEEARGAGFLEGVDMIVPVPLARRRERERGYNQSEMVATGMADVTGIPMRTDIVMRTAYKASQTALSRSERRDNVEGLFALRKPEEAEDRHILLIDDILTTGATIVACAEAFLGVKGVRFSVLTLGFTES